MSKLEAQKETLRKLIADLENHQEVYGHLECRRSKNACMMEMLAINDKINTYKALVAGYKAV